MKRMIRAKTTITADSDVLMKSEDGLFELTKRQGVGRNDTPWEGLSVVSNGDAEDYVVEIRLRSSNEDFEGPEKPVTYKYYDVEVAHGMRSRMETLEETERYIEVLKSALDFAKKIKNSKYISKR